MSVITLSAALNARADDKGADFTRLFNGKDLTGWTTYLQTKADPERVWTIVDGAIHCTGKPNGYILTEKEYGDYVLRVQWRWPTGTGPRANSGVFVHVVGPDKIWPKAVEAQLANGAAGDFWLVDGFQMKVDKERQDPRQARHYIRIGERYENGQPKRKAVEKAIGEWNQYEITCQGNSVKLVVNGHAVNEGTGAELTNGKILLQSEGSPIEFRNIEIKMLK